MRDDVYYLLAYILIAGLLLIEVMCGYAFKKEMKKRSDEKQEERRAATRPKAYKEVHDSWTMYRNRRSLWDSLKK